jgi:hypothetical protein
MENQAKLLQLMPDTSTSIAKIIVKEQYPAQISIGHSLMVCYAFEKNDEFVFKVFTIILKIICL